MKSAMQKGAFALSSIAMLLALGACGDRETAKEVASTDPRTDASTQVTGQATDISKNEKNDTAVMGASGTTAGEKIDDAQIVSKIKTEFAADKDISAMAIDVDSKDGMVTLSGTVPNSDAKVRADQIAKAARDVKSVNNLLEVKAG
jgi:hyperosmotically inducible protein